ncbi:helix-turn-helix domain-containing protein [Brucella pseudogrignonensis]|uniref:helix-turn-helix domain-containing protein n=1 Tax=Brucella pseudogrignonensis TaxID=419475 RepID=UPI000A015C85|nr:helix-turn-helix transcriptional regulator [Brucella pseudogrignonensis]
MISPHQSRGARGLLDWSQTQLADAASVSLSTVRDFEKGRRIPIANNLHAIQKAFENEGIEFVSNHPRIGVVRVMPPSLFDNLD